MSCKITCHHLMGFKNFIFYVPKHPLYHSEVCTDFICDVII